MNKEEELTDILRKVEWGKMDSTVAFDRIFLLFNVVAGIEQLECNCCNGSGLVEGDCRDEFEACLTCNGRGKF